jgi:hypothetical protein
MKAAFRFLKLWLLTFVIVSVTWGVSSCDRLENLRGQFSRSEPSPEIQPTELIYQTAAAELQLSKTSDPYFVLDIPRRSFEIRVKGALVHTVPLEFVEVDSSELQRFALNFVAGGRSLVRPLLRNYLFGAQDQTPDSILTIVSNVVNVSPELLQREIPSRFRMYWDEKLIFDVVSEVESTPKAGDLQEKLQSKLENTMMEARYVMRRPFGARQIVIKAKPEDALTIYRLATPGRATLMQLVKTEAQVVEKKKPPVKKK